MPEQSGSTGAEVGGAAITGAEDPDDEPDGASRPAQRPLSVRVVPNGYGVNDFRRARERSRPDSATAAFPQLGVRDREGEASAPKAIPGSVAEPGVTIVAPS